MPMQVTFSGKYRSKHKSGTHGDLHPDEFDTAVCNLGSAVLNAALKDISVYGRMGQRGAVRKQFLFRAEIREWIVSSDFEFWCDVAGIDANIAREKFENAIEASERCSPTYARERPASAVHDDILRRADPDDDSCEGQAEGIEAGAEVSSDDGGSSGGYHGSTAAFDYGPTN